MLYAIYRYLQDPNQVESVLKLGNQLVSKDGLADYKDRYLQNPQVAEMIKTRYGNEAINIKSLAAFAEGTLGRAYFDFINSKKLNSDFYKNNTKQNFTNDSEYIVFRIRQTHDLWHVLTGFETTQQGEAGLIAFYYAQLRSPLSGLIVGLAFIHFLLKRPKDLPSLFDEVTTGWVLGAQSKPLLPFKWEEHWGRGLDDIRKELNCNLKSNK